MEPAPELPDSIAVGLYTFRVIRPVVILGDDGKPEPTWGETSLDELTISVRRDLSGDAEAETALHELLHAIGHQSGCLPNDDDEEERIVKGMSAQLYLALKQNPAMLEYLYAAINRRSQTP